MGEAAAGAVDVAASGVGDVAVAGVGVGEAFVSSAREAVPLADKRTTTVPARTNERIFVTQFNIVWVGFDRWFLVKACWHRPFLFVEKPQRTTGRVYYGVCKPVLAVLVPLGNTSGDQWIPALRALANPKEQTLSLSKFRQPACFCTVLERSGRFSGERLCFALFG